MVITLRGPYTQAAQSSSAWVSIQQTASQIQDSRDMPLVVPLLAVFRLHPVRKADLLRSEASGLP